MESRQFLPHLFLLHGQVRHIDCLKCLWNSQLVILEVLQSEVDFNERTNRVDDRYSSSYTDQ
ncbi:unnamed protein product [Cuscuta epithymum]|uniref:Uncharacterized protein n=1 Tax=Cuscuta epithymum TaxID=186058 RepID=A0AAV0CDP5_9ASTE|nr:unnamed protein product [Cuscuta epithymum]